VSLGLRTHCLLFWIGWIGLAIAPACVAEDLCPLLTEEQGFAPPAIPEAYAFLDSVGKLLGTPTGIRLFPSSNALVNKRAAAQMCGPGANQRWIFYDESYLNSLPPNGRNFILAHEAAHHISGDTLLADTWTKELELAADYSAAVWLTRLGVTRDQLLQAFDALSFPVESQTGYPTRAERRAKVVQGNADSSNAISGTVPDVIIQPPPPQPQTFPVYIVVRHHWINNKKLGVVNSGTITIRIDDALDYKFDVTENFQDQRVDLTAGQHEVEFAANVRAENWNTGIHATGKCLQSLQISKSATFEPYIAFDERGNILSCGMKPIKQ